MEITFAKDPQTNPAVPVIDINPAVTAMPATVAPPAPLPPTPEPIPANRSLAPNSLMLGDRLPTFADVVLPRLNLVQGLGELKDSFEQGSIVFNQQFPLYVPQTVRKVAGVEQIVPGTPPLTVICLGLKPDRYVEKTSGSARGIIVNTEAEVRAAGGTLNYDEWKLKAASGMKRFGPMAEALMLIEKPADAPGVAPIPLDEEAIFIYEVEGRRYTMAMWSMTWTSYTEAAKKSLFTNRRTGCLRNGYPTYSFTLATRNKQYDNGNATWIPVLLPKAKTSPALLDFAKGVLSGE